ncbi:50S ribosomal protein L25/general stress protein Ctc [Granulicoccus sp. GXG6511]|uniref:50S ribosomal protein L25/general stress protein Ctc n=1 Tax=Granulicoccus sp. GXG6511 TaxID=3381351 RepID=UPI003D7D6BB3
MADAKLKAALRSEFGKGASRRLRRDHKVPAVMYGHGTDPIHLALPGHETLLALRVSNALLEIQLDGDNQLALVKQVQRDAIKGTIEHVDLLIVRRGEKVVVEVPVSVIGEAAPETVVMVDAQTVSIEVEATHIPEQLEISIEGLEAGSQILAKDVKLPEGATIHGDEEMLVINITHQVSEEQLEAELTEAEAEAGIERDEPEGEPTETSDEG